MFLSEFALAISLELSTNCHQNRACSCHQGEIPRWISNLTLSIVESDISFQGLPDSHGGFLEGEVVYTWVVFGKNSNG